METGTRPRRLSTPATVVTAVVGALIIVGLGFASPTYAGAISREQEVIASEDPVDWTPHVLNGRILGIAEVGDKVYVGGDFTQVRQAGTTTTLTRVNLFAFDRRTGAIDPTWVPQVNGAVDAVRAGPGGTSIIIGGRFGTVNGASNFGIAKLDPATGQMVPGFNAWTGGRVRDLKVNGTKIYLGGDFWSVNGVARSRLAVIDASTGALDPTFNIALTAPRVSQTWVVKLDVNPDATKMVIMGNFVEVDGVARTQVAMIDLTTNPASLATWSTNRYSAPCFSGFWTYMRDVEFSPDGDYFAIVTTGGPSVGNLCDTTARWESTATGTALLETWADWTGGDTLLSVAVTGSAIYAGGHQRWHNNHTGRDFAGPGAVSRPGIAALDPINGVPFAWNPGKSRGVGVFDIEPGQQMVYIGSDTDTTAGEFHAKLAAFPLAGGTAPPQPTPVVLAADLLTGQNDNHLTRRTFSGSTFGTEETIASNPLTWSAIGGAAWESSRLYYAQGPDLYARDYDGTTFGPAVNLAAWNSWSNTSAMTWDQGRLYYAKTGDTRLYYQHMSLESGIVSSRTFVASGDGDGLNWNSLTGMSIAGDHLYYTMADRNLYRIDFAGNSPIPGTEVVISGPLTGDGRNWDVAGLFFVSNEGLPSVSVTGPAAGSTVNGLLVVTADSASAIEVEFFVDGASLGVDDDGTDGWSAPWDTTSSPDGPVNVSATAREAGGQEVSDSVPVTVDNNAPTITITTPSTGDTVSGGVTIDANATDAVGVVKVEFFVGGTLIGTDFDATDGWSQFWATTPADNGLVPIAATAWDAAGFSATDAVDVTVDNTGTGSVVMVVASPGSLNPGETAIKARLEGLTFSVSTIDDNAAIAGHADGASFVIISTSVSTSAVNTTFVDVATPVWVAKPWLLDDMQLTGPTGGVDYGVASVDTIDVIDPSHPMAAAQSGSVAFTDDRENISWGLPAPAAHVVATTAGRATAFVINSGDPLNDGSPAAGCRLSFPIYGSAPVSFTPPAWQMFDATALWVAGGCDTNPAPEVVITSPNDADTVTDTIVVTATATDDDGVNQVEFLANAVSIGIDSDGGDGWSISWDTTTSPDGPTTISATATDGANRTSTDAINVTIDNGAPLPGSVLMVVGNPATLTSGDDAMRTRLESRGYSVTVVDDDGIAAGDTTGFNLVFVSQNVSTSSVGDRLRNIAVPVWISKPWLFDDMDMTGPVANVNYGVTSAANIDVIDSAHPMAAGRSGTVGLTTAARTTSWGNPAATAALVATTNGNGSVFAYQPGETLFDGSTAAGCRLAFPVYQAGPTLFTPAAWAMFDATTDWAINGCTDPGTDPPPSVDITAPADQATISGTTVVTATASDDDAVTQVEFFVAAASIGVDADGGDGWSVAWDTTTAPDGAASVSATATDTIGQTTTDTIGVTISNDGSPAFAILVSVDGLRPDTVLTMGAAELPNLHRLINEGSSTPNARTLLGSTSTLPNHSSMVTSVPATGPNGHGVLFNEDDGTTIHDVAGRYVASMFDVAHDNGRSTLLYAGKPKFDFLDRSWDGTNGAPDLVGADNGTDKLDHYMRSGGATVTNAYASLMNTTPIDLSMVHYGFTDDAGHTFGWGSPEYQQAVIEVDGYVGQILSLVESNPTLNGNTVIILTADHGGTGTFHGDETVAANYTIPYYAWGKDVTVGGDLYVMNPLSRSNPGTGRPDYTVAPPPVRNAGVANVLLGVLGLGPVPASTINEDQALDLSANPSLTITITTPADGDVVSGTAPITANAAAADQVEFFVDGSSIGVDTDGTDGWSMPWDTTTHADGNVSLSATATNGGVDDATATINVTIDNHPAPDHFLFGAHPGRGNRTGNLLTLEGQIGREFDFVRVFEQWDSPFPASYHDEILDGDRLMLLSVRAKRGDGSFVLWRDIADAVPGSPIHDEIVGWAQRVRDLGVPVWFTFNHEPEFAGNIPNGDDQDFIDAWRRIHSEFVAQGVTNAEYVWIMTDFSYRVDSTDRRYAPKWYPGDDVVDHFAIDAYNYADCRPDANNPWRSLEWTIEDFRQFGLSHPDKGLLLAEWGSTELPGDKAAWIDDAAALFQQPEWDQFIGVAYFNDGDAAHPDCDFLVTSSPAVLSSFTAMGDLPFYGGSGSTANSVLLVAGDPASLSTGDQAVRLRLESSGHVVTLADDDGVAAADAAGFDLVIISHSVTSGKIGSTFRDTSTAVWVAKPWLLDDMDMTGPVAGSDYGVTATTDLTIVDSTHPMAAGLTGVVALTTATRSVSWGDPVPAMVVATANDNGAVFAYRAGDNLSGGGSAAGCRLSFPLYRDGPTLFTIEAWAMFDATTAWAMDACP